VFTGERLFGSTLVYACVDVDGIDRACCEFTVGAWAAKPPGMNRLGGKVSILSLKMGDDHARSNSSAGSRTVSTTNSCGHTIEAAHHF